MLKTKIYRRFKHKKTERTLIYASFRTIKHIFTVKNVGNQFFLAVSRKQGFF